MELDIEKQDLESHVGTVTIAIKIGHVCLITRIYIENLQVYSGKLRLQEKFFTSFKITRAFV